MLRLVHRRSDQHIVAFLLGSYDTGRFYKRFLRTRSLQALRVIGPKLLSLKRVFKVIETLVYPAKKDVASLPPAELLDLAVARDAQGQGLGRKLFGEFVTVLKSRGVSQFRITTGASLTGAHRFYEGLGAQRVSSIQIHRGSDTYVYVYDIPGRSVQADGPNPGA